MEMENINTLAFSRGHLFGKKCSCGLLLAKKIDALCCKTGVFFFPFLMKTPHPFLFTRSEKERRLIPDALMLRLIERGQKYSGRPVKDFCHMKPLLQLCIPNTGEIWLIVKANPDNPHELYGLSINLSFMEEFGFTSIDISEYLQESEEEEQSIEMNTHFSRCTSLLNYHRMLLDLLCE